MMREFVADRRKLSTGSKRLLDEAADFRERSRRHRCRSCE